MWRDTVIVQIDKGKAKANKADLESKRHIHTKPEIQKFFAQMVTSAAKPMIVENMSPFQIGAVPGHRSQEHLFSLKSFVAMIEDNNEAIAVQLFDLVKFFDSESLVDGLNELYRSNVKGKRYRLLYELNKDTRIMVRTPVGDSEKRETGKIFAQGSPEGSLASSSNISSGVSDFFQNSENEVFYGILRLLPQSFQDDLLRMCTNPISAQFGNDRMQNLAETKLLSYNLSKTCIVFLGAKKAREKLRNDFIENPPVLFGLPVKLVLSESYLGDQIGDSVSDSTTLTINKREGLAKEAIFEIKNIVEDCRSKVIGGIKTGLLLWESCIIPFLLFNSSTWLLIKQSDIDRLSKLQNLFLSTLLQAQKAPIFSLHWELGVTIIPLRILKEKLLLYHHISCLPENSLSLQILKIQERLNFSNLRDEIKTFLNEFEIVDVTAFSKNSWKKFVSEKIVEKNRLILLEMAKDLKKVDYLSVACENYGIKEYFSDLSLDLARIKFREVT